MDWLCWPRFDSPSLFARLLDLEHGGQWSIHPVRTARSAHAYVKDTNVLATTFTTDTGTVRLLDAMNIAFGKHAREVPQDGYVLRTIECLKGCVEMECLCAPRPDYARSAVDWRVDNERLFVGEVLFVGPRPWKLDERTKVATCRCRLQAGERVAFMLCGSNAGPVSHPFQALDNIVERWRDWSRRCTYEGRYREQVVRSCLALKLLQDMSSGAIVAAPTTSLPEEVGGVRNWDYRFSWIRDASFTLYALLLAGFVEEPDAFFDRIVRTVRSEGTGIRVLYPIDPQARTKETVLHHFEGYRRSAPVRIGNDAADQLQLDVYGEVFDALAFACRAGGYDPSHVWDHFRPLADRVAADWELPENGIWEVRGGRRHFVFGKVMCWVALDRAIDLAEHYSLPGDTAHWRQVRNRIKRQVHEKGWSAASGTFKQSYEDDRCDAANLLLPTVGFIAGDHPRMRSTLDVTMEHLVQNGLCYRYLDAPEGVPGKEATFVLCTFWLVDALILAGRIEEATGLLDGILARATPLGLFAEEIDPMTNEHLGNFPQAFSHIGVINAAVSLAHVGHTGKVDPQNASAARKAPGGGAGSGASNRLRSAARLNR